MGTEKSYIALPDSSSLLARAENDPEFGEYLASPTLFAKGGIGCRVWDEVGREFHSAIEELNKEHPGLSQRVYTLDRWYDKLHYLLSAKRRRSEVDREEWASKAILGAKALPDHLRGGQGHPIRYSPYADVRAIVSNLELVTIEDLHKVYNPVAMEEQGVYKNNPDDNDGKQWQFICSYFEAWKAFYLEVAECRAGVLVVTT